VTLPTLRVSGNPRPEALRPQQRGILHEGVETASTPILLVHGIDDNHSIFTVLERALRGRGFRNLAWFDYGLRTGDVRRAAKEVGPSAAATGQSRIGAARRARTACCGLRDEVPRLLQ
jgi:triacylglycerol lipase